MSVWCWESCQTQLTYFSLPKLPSGWVAPGGPRAPVTPPPQMSLDTQGKQGMPASSALTTISFPQGVYWFQLLKSLSHLLSALVHSRSSPKKPSIPGLRLGNCGNPGYSHCAGSATEAGAAPSSNCPLSVSPTISQMYLMIRVTWGTYQLTRSLFLCCEDSNVVGETWGPGICLFVGIPGDSHHQG